MSRVEVSVLRDTQRVEGNPAVLIRTGGGNAPFLMGLRVLDHMNVDRRQRGLSEVDGIFPNATDRQVKLLREEAQDPRRVLIDPQYARIVEPYTSSHGDFARHLDIVVAQAGGTKQLLMNRFGKDAEAFDAMSLGLGETVTHSPRDIIGVLDAGARYPGIEHPEHHFFFPVLASPLWRQFRQEQLEYNPAIRISDSSLAAAIQTMEQVEAGYKKVYLSEVNTFSYLYIPEEAQTMDDKLQALFHQPTTHLDRPILYTPPMSPNTKAEMPVDDVEKPSIFVMFSGTGSAIEETNALIPQIVAAGYDVYVPESAIKFGDLTEENMEHIKVAYSPTIIFHPNIHGVVARPGFGTIWDDENAAVDTLAPHPAQGDDFETKVNARTLEALGIGVQLQPGETFSPDRFRQDRVRASYNAQALKEGTIARFGTKDGLLHVAREVGKDVQGYMEDAPEVLDREILTTDAYEIKFLSPEGFRMETDQVLSWYDLARSFGEGGELSDKQQAWVDQILASDTIREGTWKYALRNVRQDGDRLVFDAGIEPFGGYETIGDPTDPQELVALASPHGNASVLITADKKLVVQYRKPWDEETRTGNYFYGGIPGASVANLFSAQVDEAGQEILPTTKPKAIGNADIEADVLSRASREIGLSAENITSVRVIGFAEDRVRVHTESLIRAETDLTFDQMRERTPSVKDDADGFAEQFFAIDATSDAIETFLTKVRVPLPPTHTAAYVSVGYSLKFEEGIESGLSQEDAQREANRFMKRVQKGVQDNIEEINKIVRGHWRGKSIDAMRPSGGKEYRNTTGFDPGYSAEEQGLPDLYSELVEHMLVA